LPAISRFPLTIILGKCSQVFNCILQNLALSKEEGIPCGSIEELADVYLEAVVGLGEEAVSG
jgi:hypothetical protein